MCFRLLDLARAALLPAALVAVAWCSMPLALAQSGGLQVVFVAQNGTPFPDETSQLTLAVANTGTNELANVQINVVLPQEIGFFTAPVEPGCNGSCGNNETMVWDLGTLAPGQSESVGFNVEVGGESGESARFDVTGSADGISDVETELVLQFGNRSLDVSVVTAPEPLTIGTQTTYTVVVSNRQTAELPSATVTLELPDELAEITPP